MKTKLTMIYWKNKKTWVGKLLEYPEIMTQGATLTELEENMRETYYAMMMDEVPVGYKVKQLSFSV
jgi:predicted RNase H-like HicB family nuclease